VLKQNSNLENRNDGIKIRQLMEIFMSFFRIGCFTFGGGYAMIPLIEKEVVTKKEWIKEEDIIDIFAVSQSIPGAIAINSATFIGYKIAGRLGALSATLGVVLPSFIIITIIAAFFGRFQDNPYVQRAFIGIRATVVGFIAMAAWKIGKKSVKDKFTAGIAAVTILLVIVLDIHAIYIIIAGALAGILAFKLFPKRLQGYIKEGGEEE
jgi:chromate transporter